MIFRLCRSITDKRSIGIEMGVWCARVGCFLYEENVLAPAAISLRYYIITEFEYCVCADSAYPIGTENIKA